MNTLVNKLMVASAAIVIAAVFAIPQARAGYTPPLYCNPATQTVSAGQNVTLVANGGYGNYSWTTSAGRTGTGQSFTTSFAQSGNATVRSDDGQTAVCTVTVAQSQTKGFTVNTNSFCVGSATTYDITGTSNLAAKDITGTTDSSPVGSQSHGVIGRLDSSAKITITGRQWTSADIGHWKRTLTIDGISQSVEFDVRDCSSQNSVVCSPQSQNGSINQNLNFTVTGGSIYNWSAPGSTRATSTGQSFSTSYATAGDRQVTVTSGTQSATCNVHISAPIVNTLQCAPQNQTAQTGQQVNFGATGGNGSFAWTGQNGQTGNGASFSSTFNQTGSYSVTVRSGDGQTSTCNVTITAAPQNLVCNSASQNVNVNQSAVFTATGGNGSYNWSAIGGNTLTGTGSSFSTTYSASGSKSVTVTSGSQTASCAVNVNQVAGGSTNLIFSKKAVNNTKSTGGTQKDATTLPADREDYITYTLTVQNTGNTDAANYVITDNLSQVLPYADISDNGGGTVSNNVITFPAMNVPQNGSISKSFTVRVKYFLASAVSYSLVNTYGNTVTIRINSPEVKGEFIAPKTGASTNALTLAFFAALSFGIYKKRKLLSRLILN